jgi:hypothetical protein
MKPVRLTTKSWNLIQREIKKDYPASVLLISWKMKNRLGFIARDEGAHEIHTLNGIQRVPGSIVLDFFSEHKKSFFLLKYSELLHEQ